LKNARERGDWVILGLYTDKDINKRKGANYPIMNLHERVLCALACKYVDEVIIGAPFHINEDLITDLRVSLVLHCDDTIDKLPEEADPYEVAKRLNIYEELPQMDGISTSEIITRIINRRLAYEERNKKKQIKNALCKPHSLETINMENS